MNAIDHQILEFCRDGFRPLKPLIGPIASGTVYRHARRLGALDWLRKEGSLYRTTDVGLPELDAGSTRQPPDPLVALYPPIAQVPTAVHRALIALILAAAVARHHEVRHDRHPIFVLFGATFRWKSSAGRFLCYALGLDPATHIVDCGTESGKSLTFRRGGTGAIVSRRALLDAPLERVDLDRVSRASSGQVLGHHGSGLHDRGDPKGEVAAGWQVIALGTTLLWSDLDRQSGCVPVASYGTLRHSLPSREL